MRPDYPRAPQTNAMAHEQVTEPCAGVLFGHLTTGLAARLTTVYVGFDR